jgi:autotransporter translocation and assembly factor TamB
MRRAVAIWRENAAEIEGWSIREGGKVFLQGREFTIDSGSLIYNGTLDPDLAIRAETLIKQIGSEDIQVTVAVNGPLLGPDLTLTSDPSYSEREIVSLIATGRRNVALDSSAWIAGGQATALLAGRVTRNVAKGLMELGIDEVDIQPELLAREENPAARFTFGKQLTPNFKIVYSTALNDAEGRFFQAQYRLWLGRELTANVQRDDTGIYSYGAGQRWRWGGAHRRRPSGLEQEKRVLEEVRFEGELPLPVAELQRSVKARPTSFMPG